MNAGEEDLCELVVTRGDSPEMLELIEETLNEIAFAVEGEVARAGGFRLDFDGMTGAIARSLRAAMKASASNALSAIKAPGSTASMRGSSASQIVILARAEHHLDRVAEGIDERVNFGGQSAAGSADGLRAVFFWAPALCW